MRFLLLNQFYPPDPAPTGQYLHDLAQVLVGRGHEVQVLCSRRSYDGSGVFAKTETLDHVAVQRLPATGFGRRGFFGKLADYCSYYGLLVFALFFNRSSPDLILSLTTPPYVGLLGKLAARIHGCRHADWVMDLYPDVMFAHGLARQNGIPFRVLAQLTRFQLRSSQPVLALGATMAERVGKYVAPASAPAPVAWLPLWSGAALSPWPVGQRNPLREERGWAATDVIFLYSGNMGLGHRFTEFLAAADALAGRGLRWAFCGSGKRRVEIETFAQQHPKARIELLNYAPQARLREHLCAADVHLLSLEEAWQGYMVPSKLQASFAVGRPVIYVGGRDCETAQWIAASGGGWIVAPNDLPGLQAAIQAALDPEERSRRGAAARQFAAQHFDRTANCQRLAQLLETPNP